MTRPTPIVVGISGPLAAGKTTLAHYAADALGFALLSTRALLEEELKGRERPVSREALQDLGQEIQEERGELWITDRLLAVLPEGPVVIDAIRHIASLRRLRASLGERFRLIYVTAPDDVRLMRYLVREGAEVAGFDAAMAHPVESEVGDLEPLADTVLSNRGSLLDVVVPFGSLLQSWRSGKIPLTFQIALAAVEDFHVKHGFEVGTGTATTLLNRLSLVMEELGEVARWATRGEGDLAEEHADLLILVLGNAVAMSLDLEEAFVLKSRRILARTAKWVHGQKRVSDWGREGSPASPSRVDRYRLELPMGPLNTAAAPSMPRAQLDLPFNREDDRIARKGC